MFHLFQLQNRFNWHVGKVIDLNLKLAGIIQSVKGCPLLQQYSKMSHKHHNIMTKCNNLCNCICCQNVIDNTQIDVYIKEAHYIKFGSNLISCPVQHHRV